MNLLNNKTNMNKTILTILFFIGLSSSVYGQKFEPQIKIGYSYGLDTYKNHSFGGEFLAGYRIIPQLRLGIGVGIDYCEHKYEDAHYNTLINRYQKEYRESAAYIPLFLNGKYNFTEGKISPYVTTDIGYSFFIPYSDYAKENSLGVFVKPGFGVDFNIGKGDIFVEVNYTYQTRKFYETCNYSQIGLSIGYQF